MYLKICQKVSKIEFMKVKCNSLNQASSIRVDIWWLSYFHTFLIVPFVVESISNEGILSHVHVLILLLSCVVSRSWHPLFKNICFKVKLFAIRYWNERISVYRNIHISFSNLTLSVQYIRLELRWWEPRNIQHRSGRIDKSPWLFLYQLLVKQRTYVKEENL